MYKRQVLARVEGLDRDFAVRMVGRADVDRVHRGIVQELFKVLIDLRAGQQVLPEAVCRRRLHIRQRGDLAAVREL